MLIHYIQQQQQHQTHMVMNVFVIVKIGMMHVGIGVLLVKKANNYEIKLVLCQFSNSNLTQIPITLPPLSSTKAMNA